MISFLNSTDSDFSIFLVAQAARPRPLAQR